MDVQREHNCKEKTEAPDECLSLYQSLKHIQDYDEWLANASTRFCRPYGSGHSEQQGICGSISVKKCDNDGAGKQAGPFNRDYVELSLITYCSSCQMLCWPYCYSANSFSINSANLNEKIYLPLLRNLNRTRSRSLVVPKVSTNISQQLHLLRRTGWVFFSI